MQAVALLAAALATVTPAPSLDNGAASFSLRFEDGVERVRETALAAPRRTAIGAYLTCRSGRRRRPLRDRGRARARGQRGARRRPSGAPGALEGAERLGVRRVGVHPRDEGAGLDPRGPRLRRRRAPDHAACGYEPAEPCPMARPPEPKPFDPQQVDPDIVTGEIARELSARRAPLAPGGDRRLRPRRPVLVLLRAAGQPLARLARARRAPRPRVRVERAGALPHDPPRHRGPPGLARGRVRPLRRAPPDQLDGARNIADDELTISTRRFRRR